MSAPNGNPLIKQRLEELTAEGERLLELYRADKRVVVEHGVMFTQWITSSLNLLDKLSVSTNRFVREFERWVGPGRDGDVNLSCALGVLIAAKDEYSRGLAVEYHLSVSAYVFAGILDEADYLCKKGYDRAAAVLAGAALEEGLKSRARAAGLEVGPRETLSPVIAKLKSPDVGVRREFDARNREAIAKLRNDAAHGAEFTYTPAQISKALAEVRSTLERSLRQG